MTKRISAYSTLGSALATPVKNFIYDLLLPLQIARLRNKKIHNFAANPKALKLYPKQAGANLLEGKFYLAGQEFDTGPKGEPWTLPVPSEDFANELHQFNWLALLAANPNGAARQRAKFLVDSWITTYGKWNDFTWREDRCAARLFNWLAYWGTLLDGSDHAAQIRRGNIYRHASYLRKNLGRIQDGPDQILACTALSMAGAMLDEPSWMDRNLDRLDEHLERQILPDGGHISRQPQIITKLLGYLLTLENTLIARGVEGSRQTRRSIDRLVAALIFFTHADGGLPSFHGSGEGDARLNKALIKAANIKAKPFSYMPHSGYQRLEQNGVVLLMDTGTSPPRPFDLAAHLSPLAFELSCPSGRLFVNCGYNENQAAHWQSVMRQSAAHTMLILDDCSAGEIVNSRYWGPAITREAGPANAQRKELDDAIWLEGSHDGYLGNSGLTHRRRIYMDQMGADIRGEDSLSVPMNKSPLVKNASYAFALRFHIHPETRVTLSRDLASALLILPNGEGWRFRTDSGPLTLEKSVYLGRENRPERCEQLVINGKALSDNNGEDKSNRVRWSIKKLGQIGKT